MEPGIRWVWVSDIPHFDHFLIVVRMDVDHGCCHVMTTARSIGADAFGPKIPNLWEDASVDADQGRQACLNPVFSVAFHVRGDVYRLGILVFLDFYFWATTTRHF